MRSLLRPTPRTRPELVAAGESDGELVALSGVDWVEHENVFNRRCSTECTPARARLKRVGVDVDQFRACLGAGARARIEEDLAHARQAGVTSTPSFLIGIVEPNNTLRVLRHESGAIPTAAFARMLDDALKTAGVSSTK